MVRRKDVVSGMWRVDPMMRTRVIDRFGRAVATAQSEDDASIIATAPDMYELLEKTENHDAMPVGMWQEIQFVLRRARGDLGLLFSCCGIPKIRQAWNNDWLKFVRGLWDGEI